MDKVITSILEGVKELLRTGILAAIPVLIDGLTAGVIDWRLAGIAFGIAALRAVDKLLHEAGKVSNSNIQGLVGF